ncbi:3'-5' exonuclease [Amycolatopsis sp. cmx-11-32]
MSIPIRTCSRRWTVTRLRFTCRAAAEALGKLSIRDPGAVIGPGVHLLNAHTGKGQQFDWVFIPGFEEFQIPSGQKETVADEREELRVLLVMLSRARHGIVLSRAAERLSKRGRLYAPDTSRWWASVTAACVLSPQELKPCPSLPAARGG